MTREVPETLASTWRATGIQPRELDGGPPRATLRRPERGAPAVDRHFEELSREITVGPVLGEGGMGVVHVGAQRSLRREVAVKRLRSESPNVSEAERLLREARITGRLEHPNVVPIHLVDRDQAGDPLIVMKRIEGRPWTELLREASPEERASEAYQRRHLGVLIQVARSLHFAHQRRVLHRDIKPDNVMIGSFGEVYLVDWGIAVGLEPVPDGLLPASEVRQIEGTPVYLAPEMAAGAGLELDERTDVYLLGATLHEVLTGEPPHHAREAREAVVRAFLAEPPYYPDTIPEELASIARRALSRERADRYPSAEAFAIALESFLVHRGSTELREVAARRASELEGLLKSAEGPLSPRCYALFHEARFAFEHALSTWPENVEADRGLRDLSTSMIEAELERGTAGAAMALLRAFPDPPAELSARVERAVNEERDRLAALSAMAHDADFGVGAQTRQRLTYVAAVAWGSACVAAGVLSRAELLVVDHLGFALINLGFCAGTAITMGLTWRQSLTNAANRRVAYTTMLVFGAGVILWPLFGALGLTMPESTLLGAFISALLWASATFTLGVPWIPMAIGQLVVTVAVYFVPEYHFEIFGVGGALQTAVAARLMIRR
jgi:predicted Ser/Thr protein kinase